MGRVVSLGSVNVDHVRYCGAEWIAERADRYAWFPAPGETVAVESVPEPFAAAFDRTFLGGKGANQAVAAAAAGAETALLGAVGEDEGEYAVCETLAGRGVDVSEVDRVDGPTGAAYVAVDETGENHIAILAGANATVDADYVGRHVGTLRDADCLLLQNEIPVEAALAALDALGPGDDDARPVVVFDPAPAGGAARVIEHGRVDVLTPNDGEYERLRDAIGRFDGVVVRTRGADGVVVEGTASGVWTDGAFDLPSPSVEPVDATGAGDVFDGYLAAALAAGSDFLSAVEVATGAAALSTTEEGVQTAVPSRDRVDARDR